MNYKISRTNLSKRNVTERAHSVPQKILKVKCSKARKKSKNSTIRLATLMTPLLPQSIETRGSKSISKN